MVEVDVGEVLDDVGAVAALLEQAERDEPLDGLADRGAGDAELVAQLALGRQLRARRHLAVADLVDEDVADLLGDRAPGDGLEADASPRSSDGRRRPA